MLQTFTAMYSLLCVFQTQKRSQRRGGSLVVNLNTVQLSRVRIRLHHRPRQTQCQFQVGCLLKWPSARAGFCGGRQRFVQKIYKTKRYTLQKWLKRTQHPNNISINSMSTYSLLSTVYMYVDVRKYTYVQYIHVRCKHTFSTLFPRFIQQINKRPQLYPGQDEPLEIKMKEFWTSE
jgi:hypothetical protein